MSDARRSETTQQRHLGALLGRVLAGVRRQGVALERAQRAWEQVCAPPAAGRTRVRRYRDGVLWVEVADGALLGELSVFERPRLEATLRETLPGFRTLRFRAAEGAHPGGDEMNTEES